MAACCTLLVVEGWLDAEVCARLLKSSGFNRVQKRPVLASLDANLVRLLPKSDPAGADLNKRAPMPLFLAKASGQSVVIRSAGGDSSIINALKGDLLTLGPGRPDAVGVLLDADGSAPGLQSTPALNRYSGFTRRWFSDIEAKPLGIQWPTALASTSTGSPRCGAFILPDNQHEGTMEALVLEAGAAVYPELTELARDHVDSARLLPELDAKDLEELGAPFGKEKAIAAAMTAILKPGKTTLTSIQDHRWLEGDLSNRPLAKSLQNFLHALIA